MLDAVAVDPLGGWDRHGTIKFLLVNWTLPQFRIQGFRSKLARLP